MKPKLNLACLTVLLLMTLVAVGCRQHAVPPEMKSEFDQKIDALVDDAVASARAKVSRIAPAAVISKAGIDGKEYTRLDETIVQRLEDKLSQDREIVRLSRENWFEIRENAPFSLKGHSLAYSDLFEGSIVFVVDVEPDEVFERVKVSITARDTHSRSIPGVGANTTLAYFSDSPATLLYNTRANTSPAPPGLAENPYRSMERLSYSLARELAESLKRGLASGRYKASKDEIQVVLCERSFTGADPAFQRALMQELQQALVSMEGMTCAVSREDFNPVFNQINFYRQNASLFEIDAERFKPGSVLLMADTKSRPGTAMKQVSLRAVWRVTPLRNAQGEIITQNSSGTYVSGFTSRAWFSGQAPRTEPGTVVYPRPLPTPKYQAPDKGFD